jgi:hypothetical protein
VLARLTAKRPSSALNQFAVSLRNACGYSIGARRAKLTDRDAPALDRMASVRGECGRGRQALR